MTASMTTSVAELTAYARKVVVGDGLSRSACSARCRTRSSSTWSLRLVEEATAKGGRVLTRRQADGGPGYFYPVTLVADVDHGMPAGRRGAVRPGAADHPLHDVEEVIARANASSTGLGGSVWGSDLGRGKASGAADRVRLGLDQQARRDPAQRAVRRRQAVGHRRRVRRRRVEGVHHRPDGVLLVKA